MTGKDLIKFIQDNKLENEELQPNGMVGQVQFGPIFHVNGENELIYFLNAETCECTIELCQPLSDTEGDFTNPSTAEALKLRENSKKEQKNPD